MELHFVITMVFLAWSFVTGVCQEGICSKTRGVIECCVDYREINDTCVLCPEGYHGSECKTPCPDGFYGAACRESCECEEEQTCDPMRGCVMNLSEENVSSTTENHFTLTRQLWTTNDGMTDVINDELTDEIPRQYLYFTTGGVVFLIIAVCLFVRHRCRKKNEQSEDTVDSVNEIPSIEIDPEDVPAPIVSLQPSSHQGANGSDYAEIREQIHVYGDSHEDSGVYNVLSFSRNKTYRQTHGSIQAVYDTSKLPALRNEDVVNAETSSQSMDEKFYSNTDKKERKSSPI